MAKSYAVVSIRCLKLSQSKEECNSYGIESVEDIRRNQ